MAYPFSPDVWATIKAAYESGKYRSCKEIYNNINILFPNQSLNDLPTLNSIIDKKVHEKWDNKTSSKDLFAAAFERIGIDVDNVAERVKNLMDAEMTKITPSNNTDADGTKESGFAEIVPDQKARIEGIKLYRDFTGTKAAEKSEVEANLTGSALPDVIKLELVKPAIEKGKLEIDV
jgi:hypothetical protein